MGPDAIHGVLRAWEGGQPAVDAEDLVDLFEQRAANGTTIREIVGEDPVEFAEAFLRNYPEGQWISRKRDRLTSVVERAAGEDTGN